MGDDNEFQIFGCNAVYNSGKFIKEAIDSLISQSLDFAENIELIVIDDNSVDDTKRIVNDYIDQYPPNIRLIENASNKGPAYSRNHGLKEAKGKYISFLGSDDAIDKEAFEKSMISLKITPLMLY